MPALKNVDWDPGTLLEMNQTDQNPNFMKQN